MTNADKISMVKVMTDDSSLTDAVITVYLNLALDSILHRRYPFGTPTLVEPLDRYDILQCKLATRYILRRGGEGETGHSENGVNRTYGSVNDEDLLSEIVQVVL